MRLSRVLAGGAGVAAAVYAGNAALTWLQYGHPVPVPSKLLDELLPNPEAVERHFKLIEAPADVVFDECRNAHLMDTTTARALIRLRALLMGGRSDEEQPPGRLVEQMTALGWTVLGEVPGRELVLGVAAKPWQADAGFHRVDGAFADFNEPGWVKIVWGMAVNGLSPNTAFVRTETRAVATDEESRRKFRRYWSLVSPGINLIRLAILRDVRAKAEARVRGLRLTPDTA